MISLLKQYEQTRKRTELLCEPLEIEDFVVQPTTDVSPPKWHLGHTTWFFENFILKPHLSGYREFNPYFPGIFNSYYKSQGFHWEQAARGHLSRPTVQEVFAYRAYVNEHIIQLVQRAEAPITAKPSIAQLLEVGLHHEQQHQELLLMDIKNILAQSPFYPRYRRQASTGESIPLPLRFVEFPETTVEFGFTGHGFCYDNELPAHGRIVYAYSLANRPITNAEYLAFIEDQGYARFEFWLSDGWNWLQAFPIDSPLYWHKKDGQWYEFTLHGLEALDLHAPVAHISFFEADAYARWRGCRLPTEFELENALRSPHRSSEQFFEEDSPLKAKIRQDDQTQSFACLKGGLWEWTSSAYRPYPGFKPFPGHLSEYNGKFMNNQYVLRGGCFATAKNHFRSSYRNFYQPDKRWMFSGIRLAKD